MKTILVLQSSDFPFPISCDVPSFTNVMISPPSGQQGACGVCGAVPKGSTSDPRAGRELTPSPAAWKGIQALASELRNSKSEEL